MPPKKEVASTTWEGAAPLSENGFTFVHGEFFAEASGKNRHRRATIEELKALVVSGRDKDKPAHWFEAQLLHYGLKPSKTKAVARMRLVDAVNSGELSVPEDVIKLETKIKREWTKKDRDLKKSSSGGDAGASGAKKTATAKRKAKDDEPATPSLAAKKTKTAAAKKTTAPKTPASKTKAAKTDEAKLEPNTPKPRTKQTARRGGHRQGPARGALSAAAGPSRSSPTRPRQTARRSSAIAARGRISVPSFYGGDYKENNHDGNEEGEDGSSGASSDNSESQESAHSDEDDVSDARSDSVLPPLRLLNGNYKLESAHVESEWSHVGSNFTMDMTLEGSNLWAAFDLGIVEGVMYFERRPWQSSFRSVPFMWRGCELDGPIITGDNYGSLKFLGNGFVSGYLDFQSITFTGNRLTGQGTRGPRTARSLQDEWNSYSEERYEEERIGRWH